MTNLVAEPVTYVDFRCPNQKCQAYINTLPVGTVVQRGYCRACGFKYVHQIAH